MILSFLHNIISLLYLHMLFINGLIVGRKCVLLGPPSQRSSKYLRYLQRQSRVIIFIIQLKWILIMTFVINLAWNSQNFTQRHSVTDHLNILEPNCGICSHLIWKVLMTCMYLKAIYINGVSRNMRIRFLRSWIYSNNLSVWFDWISTYFVLFISFLLPYFLS